MKLRCTFILMLVFFFGRAQENDPNVFPEKYFGEYIGTLEIYIDDTPKRIPMEFHLLPTEVQDQYTYRLIYGEGEAKQIRDYLLRPKDPEKGIYEVDEQNGIVLENRFIGNKLYTLFEVEGSLLTTFITFKYDHLVVEIVFAETHKKQATGGREKEIPTVYTYPISVVQRAYLNKQ